MRAGVGCSAAWRGARGAGECGRMQSAGDRSAIQFYMSTRVILVTGGNGGLGQAIARFFLNESPDNQVWLGVRASRNKADLLAVEFAGRCHCTELEVTR